MSKSTFKNLFYLRKNCVNKEGKASIMIRITVNGEMSQFSCQILLYSFHVKPGTYEVGVIYVRSPELRKLGIKELHLVKAIKMKK